MDIMSNPTPKDPTDSPVPTPPPVAIDAPTSPDPEPERLVAPSPSSPPPAVASPGPCAPGRVREGGGRPPRRAESDIEGLVTLPAQFFMILEGGDPRLSGRLREMITERIAFHSAVFPYLSLPDQLVH